MMQNLGLIRPLMDAREYDIAAAAARDLRRGPRPDKPRRLHLLLAGMRQRWHAAQEARLSRRARQRDQRALDAALRTSVTTASRQELLAASMRDCAL